MSNKPVDQISLVCLLTDMGRGLARQVIEAIGPETVFEIIEQTGGSGSARKRSARGRLLSAWNASKR